MLTMSSTRSNYVYTTNQPVTGKRQTHHNRDKHVTNGNEGAGPRRTHNGRVSPKPAQNGSEDSINFKTVERIDCGVLDIVRTVSCVVVYKYLEDSGTWERTPIEGTLFIYSRDPATTTTYAHAFLILSKLTNENLVVYLEREMMVHTQPPFVLFKRTKEDQVCGLNFTDESTCREVGKELLTLCQNTRPVSPAQQRQDTLTISNRRVHLTSSPSLSSGEGDSPEEAGSHGTSLHQRKVDAHKNRKVSGRRTSEPINRTKRDSSPILIVKPNSKVNHRHSGHVHQTPPRSSGNNTRSRERGRQYHSNSFDVGQSSSDGGQPSSFPTTNLAKRLFHSATIDEASLKDTPPVLNELFASASSRTTATPISNGVSTPLVKMVSVAEIERRMSTEVTPATGSPVPSRHTLLHPSAFSNSTHFSGENVPPNGQSPSVQTSFDNRLEVNVVPPTPVGTPGSKFPAIPFPVQSPGMRSQPIASDPPPSRSTGEYTDTVEPTNEITALPEVSVTTSLAALMSPQSFSGVNRSASEPTKPKSEPTIGLTEQQLQQALLHLIKNDVNFLSTLHEAYIDSLKSCTR